jgi:anti-sigma28 factor (negative regulator of flagellin synthesis)
MVGIQGIGGVPEPRPDRPAGTRDTRSSGSAAPSNEGDDVVISSEAQAAATLAAAVQAGIRQADVRPERVEAARDAIERGAFRDPEAVKVVAERIQRLL